MFYIYTFLILFLFVVLPVIICVAYFTLAERKLIAALQRRKGPNVISVLGVLQPFADALKTLLKELIVPNRVNFLLFFLSPLLTFSISLVGWVVIPMSLDVYLLDYSLSFLLFFVISSLGFYGVFLAGWTSNSKYAVFGAIRSIAQIISYEVFIGLSILPLLLYSGSFNLITLVLEQEFIWNISIFPLNFSIFFISTLAETNRIPFDLPEAEAEIVAGYNLEYSGFAFALFFLGEYSFMLLNASILVIIFFGGWLYPFTVLALTHYNFTGKILTSTPFIIKLLHFCFLWIFIRGCLPRYRFDGLMDLGWKDFLPLTLGLFYLYLCIGFISEGLPFFVMSL